MKRKTFIACFFLLILSVFIYTENYPIAWEPGILEIKAFPGTSKIVSASFIASEGLDDVQLWIAPEIEQFIEVDPDSIESTIESESYLTLLFVSIPSGSSVGTYEGTLHCDVSAKFGQMSACLSSGGFGRMC